MTSMFDKCDGGLPCMATTTGCLAGQCSRRKLLKNADGTFTVIAGEPMTFDASFSGYVSIQFSTGKLKGGTCG